MHELKTENEKPLLVVKYVWWRILWRIFFPLSLGCFIGFLGGMALIESGAYIVGIFFYMIGILSGYAILELLMIRQFELYTDKIVKVWNFFGSKEVKYTGSMLGISFRTFSPFYSLSGYSFFQKVFFRNIHILNRHISLDRTLISEKTDNELLIFVSKLTNKNITKKQNFVAEMQSILNNQQGK